MIHDTYFVLAFFFGKADELVAGHRDPLQLEYWLGI